MSEKNTPAGKRETRPSIPNRSNAPSIGYLEEGEGAPQAGPVTSQATRTTQSDSTNQVAAARAIAAFRVEDVRKPAEKAEIVPLSPEEEKKLQPKVYRVLAAATIRKGAAAYQLQVGKYVDDRQYDIASLRNQGVQLEELPRA